MIVDIFWFLIWSTLLEYNEKFGIILRWKSFWIGLHYSDYNDRYCLNIIPCFTIWWIGKNGKQPNKIL